MHTHTHTHTQLIECLLEWLSVAQSDHIKAIILGESSSCHGMNQCILHFCCAIGGADFFSVLKSCEEYKSTTIWSTVAHLL